MKASLRGGLLAAVAASGAAGLIWEILWQHHGALAFGVSAKSAAITLTSAMAGFAIGGLLVSRLACRRRLPDPLTAYAIAEVAIAAFGVALPYVLALLARLDAAVWARTPTLANPVQVLGTLLVLLGPAIAMGATVPILGSAVEASRTSLGIVYAVNTLGATAGIVLATFVALPTLGVRGTGLLAAGLNLAAALWAVKAARRSDVPRLTPPAPATGGAPLDELALAFVSGFVVFLLEVSWFRSLRAALQSTTESFALILAGFLLPLGVGALLAPALRRRWPTLLGPVLGLAAAAVLCATPLVDQLDRWVPWGRTAAVVLARLTWVVGLLAIPVALLGLIFPWLLDRHRESSVPGRLYAVNSIGAMLGALLAGFVLLPWLGATRTSWLGAGLLTVSVPFVVRKWRASALAVTVAALGLVLATRLDSGPGRLRVQSGEGERWGRILFVDEGPDVTVTVAENEDGVRGLIIDGFLTTAEGVLAAYMRDMGHLPALATPVVDDALVICFGTGQTANAVRKHGPRRLDLVDVSAAVFAAGDLFPANEGVLGDPAVTPIVMDGRAFLRRNRERRYDLITLEPMAPNFAGTNNLYSREFYALARDRLQPGGIAAQWLPFHLVSPEHMAAVVATFHDVFPHTRLYLNPVDGTGILVGGVDDWRMRTTSLQELYGDDVPPPAVMVLAEPGIAELAAMGEIITDDNQLLAYGNDRFQRDATVDFRTLNLLIVSDLSDGAAIELPRLEP